MTVAMGLVTASFEALVHLITGPLFNLLRRLYNAISNFLNGVFGNEGGLCNALTTLLNYLGNNQQGPGGNDTNALLP